MHINKAAHVSTIDLVAKRLGESVDWLYEVAYAIEPEDGVIWVHGRNDDGVLDFTDFGVENLLEPISIRKESKARNER